MEKIVEGITNEFEQKEMRPEKFVKTPGHILIS